MLIFNWKQLRHYAEVEEIFWSTKGQLFWVMQNFSFFKSYCIGNLNFVYFPTITCSFSSGLSVKGTAMASFSEDFLGHAFKAHFHGRSQQLFGRWGQLKHSCNFRENCGNNYITQFTSMEPFLSIEFSSTK